jgi:hypothetical protein
VSTAAFDEAQRRYPFAKRDTAANQGHRIGFQEGAEWADAQREPLTAATRDHLVTIIHTSGQSLTITESAAVADAILAVFRPVMSTRERLIEALHAGPMRDHPHWDLSVTSCGSCELRADALLASGALEDRAEVERAAIVAYEERRSPSVMIESIAGEPALEWMAKHDAEVEAKALEAAADAWTQGAWANTPRRTDRIADRMAASQFAGDWLRARAASIREGRS